MHFVTLSFLQYTTTLEWTASASSNADNTDLYTITVTSDGFNMTYTLNITVLGRFLVWRVHLLCRGPGKVLSEMESLGIIEEVKGLANQGFREVQLIRK